MRKRNDLEPRLMALTQAELAAQRKARSWMPAVDEPLRNGSVALVAAREAGELLAHGRHLDESPDRALSAAFRATGSYNMKNIWALVLAAGEGSRLRALTTHGGIAVPKQFCSLQGGPSLLQEAILRAEAVVPRQRICHHRCRAASALVGNIAVDLCRSATSSCSRRIAGRRTVCCCHCCTSLSAIPRHASSSCRQTTTFGKRQCSPASLRQAAGKIGGDVTNLYMLGISSGRGGPGTRLHRAGQPRRERSVASD